MPESSVLGERGRVRSHPARLARQLRPAGRRRQLLENYDPCHFPEMPIPLVILNVLGGKPLPACERGEQSGDWYLDNFDRCEHVRDGSRKGAGLGSASGRTSEKIFAELDGLRQSIFDALSKPVSVPGKPAASVEEAAWRAWRRDPAANRDHSRGLIFTVTVHDPGS